MWPNYFIYWELMLFYLMFKSCKMSAFFFFLMHCVKRCLIMSQILKTWSYRSHVVLRKYVCWRQGYQLWRHKGRMRTDNAGDHMRLVAVLWHKLVNQHFWDCWSLISFLTVAGRIACRNKINVQFLQSLYLGTINIPALCAL